jgi:hypothetical protein
MNPLEQLKRDAIPVTWATIAMGLDGPGSAPPQIGLSEVRSWLEASLIEGSEPASAIEVLVAIDNDAEPRQMIGELSRGLGPVPPTELRKWQLVMLRRQMADLPADPFYAALALADFWSQFGEDSEVPAPTGDDLRSTLTEGDRERLVRDQGAWLDATHKHLRSSLG